MVYDYMWAEVFRLSRKRSFWWLMLTLVSLIFLLLITSQLINSNGFSTQRYFVSDFRNLSLKLIEAVPLLTFPIMYLSVYTEELSLGLVERNFRSPLTRTQYLIAKSFIFFGLAVFTYIILIVAFIVAFSIITLGFSDGIVLYLDVLPDLAKGVFVMSSGMYVNAVIASVVLYASKNALAALTTGILFILHIPAAIIYLVSSEIGSLIYLASISWDVLYIDQMASIINHSGSLNPVFFIVCVVYSTLGLFVQHLYLVMERE